MGLLCGSCYTDWGIEETLREGRKDRGILQLAGPAPFWALAPSKADQGLFKCQTRTHLLMPSSVQPQLQKGLSQPLLIYSGCFLRSMEITQAALGQRVPSHSHPICRLLRRCRQCKLTRHHPCQRRCGVAALSSGGDVWRVPRKGRACQVAA